jgi:phosphoribosyl 1,2-cyclic phosphate phosphodiesterase
MDEATRTGLTHRFDYVFDTRGGYPAICESVPLPPHGEAWSLEGPSGEIPVLNFDLDHGGIRSVGFRFGDVAYTPDVMGIPEESWPALMDLDVWIVDALRWTPHPTHAHVARALEWIARAKPRRAILTNLHIDLDFKALSAKLPAGVEPAYDGLRFTR